MKSRIIFSIVIIIIFALSGCFVMDGNILPQDNMYGKKVKMDIREFGLLWKFFPGIRRKNIRNVFVSITLEDNIVFCIKDNGYRYIGIVQKRCNDNPGIWCKCRYVDNREIYRIVNNKRLKETDNRLRYELPMQKIYGVIDLDRDNTADVMFEGEIPVIKILDKLGFPSKFQEKYNIKLDVNGDKKYEYEIIYDGKREEYKILRDKDWKRFREKYTYKVYRNMLQKIRELVSPVGVCLNNGEIRIIEDKDISHIILNVRKKFLTE